MTSATVDDALFATFEAMTALLGAQVARCDVDSLVDVLDPLAEDGGTSGLMVTQDLLEQLSALESLVRPQEGAPVTVMSQGLLGIAATGSVAVAEERHSDRVAALLARQHILLLPIDRLVSRLHDAVPYLRRWTGEQQRYVTFVTGPSRTADIEKVLTVGAHGPARLTIVVVDGWRPDDD